MKKSPHYSKPKFLACHCMGIGIVARHSCLHVVSEIGWSNFNWSLANSGSGDYYFAHVAGEGARNWCSRKANLSKVAMFLAIVGSETLRADTDGLIISASDLTGSTVGPQTQLIQMIRPVNLRVVGTLDEDKGLQKIRVGQVVSFTRWCLAGQELLGFYWCSGTKRQLSSFYIFCFDRTSDAKIHRLCQIRFHRIPGY